MRSDVVHLRARWRERAGLQRLLARDLGGGRLFEIFLVSAVSAILLIRFFLSLTGYPQLGGNGLHIAHMLWGGLLMVAALLCLLLFMSQAMRGVAAVLGGAGFGMFIDEVGKFVTSDNNYFFQPAVALMYVVFIVTWLATRAFYARRQYSGPELVLNALKVLEEVVYRDLDASERDHALRLLRQSEQDTPLVQSLAQALEAAPLVPVPRERLIERLAGEGWERYQQLATKPWFEQVVILFFLGQLGVKLAYILTLIFFRGFGANHLGVVRLIGIVARQVQSLTVLDELQLFASALSGACVFVGIWYLSTGPIGRGRMEAWRWFRRSILISIYLTQVLAFYNEQFTAIIGLGINLIILITIGYLIEAERATKT